jgi:hypothetical protein
MHFQLFAIRHNPSGLFLPNPMGRGGRGGSHLEPSSENPRLFPTKRGAHNALQMWLKGKYTANRGYDSFSNEYYEELELIPQPSRKKEEMEVVVITCTDSQQEPLSELAFRAFILSKVRTEMDSTDICDMILEHAQEISTFLAHRSHS